MNKVSQTLALTIDKMLYMCIYVCIQIYILLWDLFVCIITQDYIYCNNYMPGLWSLPLVSFSLPFLGISFYKFWQGFIIFSVRVIM